MRDEANKHFLKSIPIVAVLLTAFVSELRAAVVTTSD